MIYLFDQIEQLDLEAALRAVSEERREQALRYRFERDQRQSVAAYLLLVYALRQEYGIRELPALQRLEGGKPLLRDYPTIHFNWSHCKRGVVCVVDRQPVGVDIEEIEPFNPELARRVLSPEEFRQVSEDRSPAEAFARLWTRKESLVKRNGTGLRSDLRSIPTDKDPFLGHSEPKKGYLYTVCYTSLPERIEQAMELNAAQLMGREDDHNLQ